MASTTPVPPTAETVESLCDKIVQLEVSSRIKAIELILQSIEKEVDKQEPAPEPPKKRGRLSELEGLFKGMYEGVDIDKFIREERDSWDSWRCFSDRITGSTG